MQFAGMFEQGDSGVADVEEVLAKISAPTGAAHALAVAAGELAAIDAADVEQQAAAGKLQGQWRQKGARAAVQEKREQRDASLKLQGQWRQKEARKVVQAKREAKAAASASAGEEVKDE